MEKHNEKNNLTNQTVPRSVSTEASLNQTGLGVAGAWSSVTMSAIQMKSWKETQVRHILHISICLAAWIMRLGIYIYIYIYIFIYFIIITIFFTE